MGNSYIAYDYRIDCYSSTDGCLQLMYLSSKCDGRTNATSAGTQINHHGNELCSFGALQRHFRGPLLAATNPWRGTPGRYSNTLSELFHITVTVCLEMGAVLMGDGFPVSAAPAHHDHIKWSDSVIFFVIKVSTQGYQKGNEFGQLCGQ